MWWSSVTTNILLFLLIFGISGTVDVTSFRSRLQDYKSLVVGVGCQFVILPLVGFAVVRTLQLPPMYGLVLLVVVSSPGGSYSNWWCSLCNADLALSVAMTTISTIASVGLLPLNILVYVNASYDEEVRISWAALLIPILVVVCAIFLGLYAGLKMPHRRNQLNALGNVCGIALIAIGAVFNGNSDVPLWSHSRIFYIAVGMPCILGAILSFALSASLRINKPAAVAITIEVCYQNTGIALTVRARAQARQALSGGLTRRLTGVPPPHPISTPAVLPPGCSLHIRRADGRDRCRRASLLRARAGRADRLVRPALLADGLDVLRAEGGLGAMRDHGLPAARTRRGRG